ncbi:MAG TPA: glycogen synthase GlgA [Syntrophobacteraceae bacterium]|nr:glycogen synthase GlgA [Syntrophobacteraceae bacterium]
MTDLRILLCSPEIAPYAKTGGLADVAAALPEALRAMGHDIRLFMPFYRCTREQAGPLGLVARDVPLLVGDRTYHATLWEGTTVGGVPIYFLEKDEFFDRSYLYGTPSADYQDNADRYIAYCQAVLPLCRHLDWFPNILHGHDWQAALISAYFHHIWSYQPDFARSATAFTIHNLSYQGIFPASTFALTQLPSRAFGLDGLEFWGGCNFLKAGLVYSNLLTTVSPRYSQEIQQPELGVGLDGVLRDRRGHLVGILNGVDNRVWNPELDPLIAAQYAPGNMEGKHRCKEALLKELDFPHDSWSYPLLAMITRLVPQKGMDLLREILDDLLALNVFLVILGTGEPETELWLKEKADQHRSKLRVVLAFDDGLAHRMEAGADIFLMPSRFEPCGLNQMYSLRYGAIPVVHAVGGLDDSVQDVMLNPRSGTGFKFYQYTAFDFFYTTRSALELYDDREKWRQLQQRGMLEDFSWERAAKAYLQGYENALEDRRASG